MAYESNESGRREVYVRPFPEVNDDQVLVSNSGGLEPLWSRDGRELFYLEGFGARQLIAVSVESGASERFAFGGREVVTDWPYLRGGPGRTYDVASDGRFLAIVEGDGSGGGREVGPPEITVVLNWFEDLVARVPN